MRKVRFAGIEVDFARQEIRKRGLLVRLQHKPFQILELLLRQPGALVTREELAHRLWPDSHVGFERGLNTAVNSLRQALGDTAPDSRFIQTRSGLGYSFIAPVEDIAEALLADRLQLAHPDCLKGYFFLDKMMEDHTRRAVGHFETALLEEGCAVRANAGLTDVWCQMAHLAMLPAQQAGSKAKEFAVLALSSDSQAAAAHIAMGRARMLCDWDWNHSQAELRRALELDPKCPHAHRFYASLLSAMGESDAALEQIQMAQTIDPLCLSIGVEHAFLLLAKHRYGAAVEQCWKVLTLEARFWPAQLGLGLAYFELGMPFESAAELKNAVVCSGRNPLALALLAYLCEGETASMVDELQRAALVRYVNPFSYALAYSKAGQTSEARRWMARAQDERDPSLIWGTHSVLAATLKAL